MQCKGDTTHPLPHGEKHQCPAPSKEGPLLLGVGGNQGRLPGDGDPEQSLGRRRQRALQEKEVLTLAGGLRCAGTSHLTRGWK